MNEKPEPVAYLNGWLIPYSKAVAKIGEGEPKLGGGFYDAERTFGGSVFRLREHLQRLYQGIEFAELDPGTSIEEMEEATVEVLNANRDLLGPGGDFILTQVVATGSGPELDVNVVVYCQPIEFETFGWGDLKGVRIITPITYTVPAQRSALDGAAQETHSLLTDENGNVTECRHANFMFVSEGRVKLPSRAKALPGISMDTVLDLADSLDIPVDDGTYNVSDVYMADEAFISGTRFCMLPVATVNGLDVGSGVPGPVTERLLAAWSDEVGMDFVKQALDHLPTEDTQVIPTLA